MNHIKNDNKYQYDPHDVATIVGKKYIEYYRERYEAWTRRRAERKKNDTKNTLNFLKVGIYFRGYYFKRRLQSCLYSL